MELRQYAALLRRWCWLLALFTLGAAGSTYLVTNSMPRVYEASTTLLVNQAQTPGTVAYNDVLANQQLTKTYSEMIKTRPVLENAISTLGLVTTADDLAKALNVQPVRDTMLLQLKAQSTDPKQTAELADAIANAFIDENRKTQLGQTTQFRDALHGQVESLVNEIKSTSDQIDQIRAAAGSRAPEAQAAELSRLQSTLSQYQLTYSQLLKSEQDMRLAESRAYSGVSVVEPAVANPLPVSPKTLQYILIAAVLGIVLAVGVALTVEYLDDTVKSGEDVAEVLGAPALGHVTRLKSKEAEMLGSLAEAGSRSPAVEAFRVLYTNLQYSMLDRPGKTILITSSAPSEGKTLTAINLARVIAQSGKRVILVDTDLRRPSIHQYLHLANNQGVTTALLDSNSLERGALQSSGLWNLTVMTSGPLPPDPSQLLASPRMAELVKLLSDKADVVLFDSPPVLAVSDPIILGALVDATLLVVDSTRTRGGALARVREMLEYSAGSSRLLGAVLNKLKPGAGDQLYRTYHHQYVPSSRTDGAASSPASVATMQERMCQPR